jgi:hypothetical protein
MRHEPPGALRPLAVAVAVGTALALLAACGGGGSSNNGDQKPVEEQLGLEQDGILERQGKAENVIRDCMKAQGFDYIPVDPQAQRAALVGQAGMSEEDFNKQYGYGITTLYGKEQTVDAANPNIAIRNGLSDADKAAYDHALYGDDTSATFGQALDTGDYSRLGGCTKEAAEKVFGGVAVFQSLQEKLDELDNSILEDGRMVKAVQAWSKCMGDAGFPDLTEQDQVDSTLTAKLEAIVGPPDAPDPNYDKTALTALQAEEVSMVAADIKCEKDHISSVEEKVRAEYESTFREQNASLLSQVPPP